MEIIPGILATSEQEYQELVTKINESESLEGGWVQLDLMDGEFVGNTSIDSSVVKKYPLRQNIEAQLMVVDPVKWVRDLEGLGIKRFVAPVEIDTQKLNEFLDTVKDLGVQSGVMISPDTAISKLNLWLDRVDVVIIMSVQPGFGGQQFLENTYNRIKELRKGNKDVKIEVDGGVTPVIVAKLADLDVSAVVVGADRLIEEGIDEYLEQVWEITTTT